MRLPPGARCLPFWRSDSSRIGGGTSALPCLDRAVSLLVRSSCGDRSLIAVRWIYPRCFQPDNREGSGMKDLIVAAILPAALALATPSAAQSPPTLSVPSMPPTHSQAWVQPTPATPKSGALHGRPHRPSAHRAWRYGHWRSSSDHVANRLNRQELMGGMWYGNAASSPRGYGPRPHSSEGY